MVVEEHLSCRSNLATALFLQTSTRCPSFAVNHFKIISVRSPYQLFLHVQNHAYHGVSSKKGVKFVFRIGTESHSCQASTYLFTAVTTNTRPERFFSSVQTCGLVDVNQPLPWFSRVGQ